MSIKFSEMFPADVVSVQGKPYLFTNMRIDRDTVPKGFHAYDVRDGDCDGEFWEIQRFVRVNHWGTICGLEEVELEDGMYWCPPEEDDPDTSSEGYFIGFTMQDQSEYVVWYHTLKAYAGAAQGRGGDK